MRDLKKKMSKASKLAFFLDSLLLKPIYWASTNNIQKTSRATFLFVIRLGALGRE